jgi:histone acetyltransferase (RNA polymerase elongator complex component)
MHDCVFCNQHRITDISADSNPLTNLKSIISDLEPHTSAHDAQLAFYGGSFTALPVTQQTELLEAAQPFLHINPQNSIRISTRPDYIDESIIKRLKEYGVKTVELGAQSMCDDVLLLSHRGHTASDVEKAAGIVKNAGFELILQMMTGLPGDTNEKSLHTAKRFVELMPNGVRIYPTVIVQGTPLYDMWKSGGCTEHTVEEAVELCALLCDIFGKADIPIIRLGLNPTDKLSAGDAAAGAYHPAFGELVRSRVYYNMAVAQLDGVPIGSDVTIKVAKGHTSMMTGQHRCNIEALTKEFSLRSLKITESTDIEQGKIYFNIW